MLIKQESVFNPLFFVKKHRLSWKISKNSPFVNISPILVYDRILSKQAFLSRITLIGTRNFGLSRFVEHSVKNLSNPRCFVKDIDKQNIWTQWNLRFHKRTISCQESVKVLT